MANRADLLGAALQWSVPTLRLAVSPVLLAIYGHGLAQALDLLPD